MTGTRRTAALVGNPNTGKTTLFNALSGLRQRTGNYAGVTVETKKGQMICAGQPFDLIDLPGTYSLAPRSPDEMVAVDVILGHQKEERRPDVVVTLVDASNLERNLYLTTQALELGVPVVVALNMVDIAKSHGIRIDVARLGKQLGVPVVAIQANKGKGIDDLRVAIARSAGNGASVPGPGFPLVFENEVAALHQALGEEVEPYLLRRLLLDVGGFTEARLVTKLGTPLADQVRQARERLAAAGCPVPAVEARTRYHWIREVTTGCVTRPALRPVTWTDRLDRIMTHRVWGSLFFLVLMFLIFQSIFTAATPLMDTINSAKEWLAHLVRDHLPSGPFASLLADGIIAGVGGVIVFLPQILILFAFIGILEDCGYMARAAFLMDRIMARCGLSGKSFIPMLSSVACAVPGIMATRVIEDRRDRVATMLVAPLMSCSARLPVYTLMIGAFLTTGYARWVPGLTLFAMYLVGLIVAPLVALILKRTLLRGDTPVFVMEMPSYKMPSLRLVMRRMIESGYAFVRRAGTMILASMVLVWALLYFPHRDSSGRLYEEKLAELKEPVADDWAKLDALEQEIAEPRKKIRTLKRQEKTSQANEQGALRQQIETLRAEIQPLEDQIKLFEDKVNPVKQEMNDVLGDWKKNSILGQVGQALEPAVRPLGWDWRIGVAALASFPAREVVVGTLGIIYRVGKVDAGEIKDSDQPGETELGKALHEATWDDDPNRKVFTVPVALSLMVFFALCCQCASTLAVIRRETRSWRWPLFTFTYMTVLAYVAALLVYQMGSRVF